MGRRDALIGLLSFSYQLTDEERDEQRARIEEAAAWRLAAAVMPSGRKRSAAAAPAGGVVSGDSSAGSASGRGSGRGRPWARVAAASSAVLALGSVAWLGGGSALVRGNPPRALPTSAIAR